MQVEACISSNFVLTLFEKSFLLNFSKWKLKQKSLWISRSIELGIKDFPISISVSFKFWGVRSNERKHNFPSKFGNKVYSEK